MRMGGAKSTGRERTERGRVAETMRRRRGRRRGRSPIGVREGEMGKVRSVLVNSIKFVFFV